MSELGKVVEARARAKVLATLRNGKMAESPHRFVRGSTAKFYEWLASLSQCAVPEVEPVWICGDCHVGNLGPVADKSGKVAIEVRDLDQTVIGNPVHDLIRLGLSLASAARGASLPGTTIAKMFEAMAHDYAAAILRPSAPSDLTPPPSVLAALRASRTRGWKALAKERLDDTAPNIPLGKRFWPLTATERKALETLVASDEVIKLVRSLKERADDAEVRMVDAAYWVKGCSSLGLMRYAVLAEVNDGQSQQFCLLDFKEATRGIAPKAKGASQPADPAKRVVTGARALSPPLGERMLATSVLGKPVFVRELMPADLKLEIETLPEDEALVSTRYLSAVIGSAHGRQMAAAPRRALAREMRTARSRSLDAPSWLWNTVVELLAMHEKAYLDHCRRQALAA